MVQRDAATADEVRRTQTSLSATRRGASRRRVRSALEDDLMSGGEQILAYGKPPD
jgi:hypothetical protein